MTAAPLFTINGNPLASMQFGVMPVNVATLPRVVADDPVPLYATRVFLDPRAFAHNAKCWHKVLVHNGEVIVLAKSRNWLQHAKARLLQSKLLEKALFVRFERGLRSIP